MLGQQPACPATSSLGHQGPSRRYLRAGDTLPKPHATRFSSAFGLGAWMDTPSTVLFQHVAVLRGRAATPSVRAVVGICVVRKRGRMRPRPLASPCRERPRPKAAPRAARAPRTPAARPPRAPRGPGRWAGVAPGAAVRAGPRPKAAPLCCQAPWQLAARPPRGPGRRGSSRLSRRSAPLGTHLTGSQKSRSLRENDSAARPHRALPSLPVGATTQAPPASTPHAWTAAGVPRHELAGPPGPFTTLPKGRGHAA